MTENTCSICLEGISKNNNTGLDCGHSFHADCVNTWFSGHNTCPNCRSIALVNGKSIGLQCGVSVNHAAAALWQSTMCVSSTPRLGCRPGDTQTSHQWSSIGHWCNHRRLSYLSRNMLHVKPHGGTTGRRCRLSWQPRYHTKTVAWRSSSLKPAHLRP